MSLQKKPLRYTELLEIPEIRQAIELAEQTASTPAELAAIDAFWDAVSTEKTLVSDNRKRGFQEGITGVTKNMLLEGIDIQLISKVTGLPISDIEKIKDQKLIIPL